MNELKIKKEYNSLPPDIIESILSSLPAKSLGRFKSVSKTWNSLISDPRFIKAHVQRHQTTRCILVSTLGSLYSIATNEFNSVDTTATAYKLSFPSPLIQWKTILGSCNGLILAKDQNYIFYVMNPTTRELWEVPTYPFALPDKKVYMKYAFGYDSLTGDYKVLLVTCQLDISEISVYSLRKNSWRKLPAFPSSNTIYSSLFYGALVNHNYHWVATSTTIHAFSFADEEFNEIKGPDSSLNISTSCEEVVEIDGKLGLFFGDDDDAELWEMQEYGNGNSWTKVCSHKFLYPVGLMCLIKGKEQDLVFDDEARELVVFSLDDGTRRKIRVVGGPSEFTKFTVEGTFVETIESPNRVLSPTQPSVKI